MMRSSAVSAMPGLTPRIGQEAIQMQTIVEPGIGRHGDCACATIGVESETPRRRIQAAVGQDRVLVETGLAWRRDNLSPVLRAFLELLRKKR